MTFSATPAPTHVLKEYSNPSFLTHPVNYWINHDGNEEWKDLGNMVESRHLAKRSPKLCKRSPFPCVITKKFKKKKKPKIKKTVKVGIKSSPFLTLAGIGLVKKKVIKGPHLIGPAGLASLTLASPPLAVGAVTLKKPLSLKAAPKLVKATPKLVIAGPKVAGPLALGPLTLGAKTLPAGAKVLKTAPLLAPAVLKKGPLAAGPLLLPLAGKATKAKKLAIPAALLISQSQGGRSQSRGSSSSGGNRTRGCNNYGSSNSRNSSRGHQNDSRPENGSSCAGEEDTRPTEDEVTTRAPTEEEKEAALEAKAALEEAQAEINQAQAAMAEALAAMRGSQLSNLSSLNLGRR